jgi:membrane-associated phospholipid phosphatase
MLDGAAERRGMHRLFAAYMLLSATALVFPHRPVSWQFLLLGHVLIASFALRAAAADKQISAISNEFPRAASVIGDWYPLLIMPLLYSELAGLNVSVWNGHYFDATIMQRETALFGGQPSAELARAWPNLIVSELLHAAYLSYYLIIFGPPLLLYLSGRRSAQREAVFALMLTFFVHYLFFIYFPVQGPRYLFPPPVADSARGPVYALAHQILETGSSRGAAFPSSHVGVSIAQAVIAFRLLPRLAPVILVLTLGLALGAVYGGFHYASDAVAGLLLGTILALLAKPVRHALGAAVEE